jgi:hypothetical protein
MKKLLVTILPFIFLMLLASSCSKAEESFTEKASQKVDEITKEAADTVVRKVRTPLNKARGTKDLGDERTDAIDKMMKEQ